MSVVYDAGVLIAVDRGVRTVIARHRDFLEQFLQPVITAPVLAQVRRSPQQVPLNRLIQGCEVVGFAPDDAAPVGALLAGAGSSDAVDAHVVVTASRRKCPVLTSDVNDISALVAALDDPSPRVRAEPIEG